MSAVDLGRVQTLTRLSLTPLVCFVSPLVTAAVPRLTWVLLPLLATAVIVPALRRGADWRQMIRPDPALVALLIVAAFVGISAIWGANPDGAISKGFLLLGMSLATFAAVRAMPACDVQQLRRAALAFVAGAFLGALFVLFELLTHAAATRFIMNNIVWLKPATPKHMTVESGQVTNMSISRLNQNVAIVMLSLWSAALALSALEEGARRTGAIILLFLATAAVVFLSDHQSSQLALLLSVPVFFLARLKSKPMLRALAALWCLAFVLVLPLDFLAYRADLHMATWMPSSFRARVIIWEYTAERVLDHPWLGVGATSTPVLNESRDMSDKPEGFVYPRNTGRHAHDLFLQTWYELGAVGVILIALAGAIVALRLSLLPLAVQPFAAATFTAFIAIAAVAWGMWQTWLVCAVGLAALYLRLAAEAFRAGAPQDAALFGGRSREARDQGSPLASVPSGA